MAGLPRLSLQAISRFPAQIIGGTGITVDYANGVVTISFTGAGGVPDGNKGDITVAGASWTINADAVTYPKMQNTTGSSLFLGRISAGAGNIEELTAAQATSLLNTFTSTLKGLVPSSGGGTANFLRADGTWAIPPGGTGGVPGGSTGQIQYNNSGAFAGFTATGDISITPSTGATVIQAQVVTYAKIQNLSATNRILGRITAGLGSMEEMTGTQVTTLLDVFTSSLKGLVPSSGGGTTTFLRADGSWASPGTGGAPGGTSGQIQYNNAGVFGGFNISGDATVDGSGVLTIGNTRVSYAKMQNVVANNVFLGRRSGAGGSPEEMTATQSTALLDLFTTGGVKGLVPGSSGGTTQFLRADGTWATPAGGGTGLADAYGAIKDGTVTASATGSDTIWYRAEAGVTTVAVGSNDATFGDNVLIGIAALGVSTAKIANNAVTYGKMQSTSATDVLLGRQSAGGGTVEEVACTAAGRSLIAGANAGAQRTTLGLGTAAVQNTGTSGANVPLMNAANTWSAQQTFVVAGAPIIFSNTNTNYFGSLANLNTSGHPFIGLHATHSAATNNTLKNDLSANRGLGLINDGTSFYMSVNSVATADADFTGALTPLSVALSTGVTTFGSEIILPASTTTRASLNVPQGAAPSSPVNGDFWTTSSAGFLRINSITKQLLSADMNLSDLASSATARANLGVDEATNTDVWTGTNATKVITPNRMFGSSAPVTVSYSATITLDMNTGINFLTTLTGNITSLANPSNSKAGQTGIYILKQDGTGSRLLSAVGSNWKFTGGSKTLSTAANAIDVITYYVETAGGTIWATLNKAFA